MHGVAVVVGEDLDLDVPRPLDQPLDVERAVAERRLRLAPRRRDRLGERRAASRATRMPLPPPPADALTRTGKPISRAAAAMPASLWSAGVRPGTTGTPACSISARAPIFDPIALDRLGRRADEDQAGVRAGLGERRALRQEAVAGMHGVGAGRARRLDDGGDLQVALARRAPARSRTARSAARTCARVRVGVGVHRDRLDAQLAAARG